MVNEKTPQAPYLAMGELLYEAQNKPLACKAIRKDKKFEQKMQMLIEGESWHEACEELYMNKKNPDFDEYREKILMVGPAFVSDFIKEQE